jgi:tetratricopeptide (TPR) repeat protein
MGLCILLFSSSCKTTQSGGKSTSGKSASEMSNKDKVTFDMLFFDANKEKILGNLDKAEVAFLEALKISPNNGAALYELANIYFYKKDKVKSLLYSKKAVAIDPSNEWFQLLYVDCLKQNKQSKEVAEVYETLIEKNPTKIEYYYELANAYLMSNKINDALKAYDKIEARFGVTEEASMQKLTIFNSLKSFDKSVAEVQKLIKAFPKEAKYYGMLGELYQSNGMNDKALQAFTDLLKIDSTNAFVHLSLADFYRNTKQNDKAFEEIKIAFKSNELDIDPKIKILLSYYEITEKFPELKPDAFKLCDILIGVHPNEAKAFAMYGDFLFRDKKLSEAREKYRKAISIDKGKYALWENLLIIDSDLNDVPSLSQESKEAMDLFPNQPLPYLFFADSNIKLKNYKEAIDALNEGKEFVIDNKILTAQFYTLIGDAQNSLKNFPASDNAYDKALELDPNNISVLNNYAYFLSLRKTNLEKAVAMSKKCNDLEPNNNSYLDTYGWILYQQSKYDDAKVWIGKALDNGGRNNGTLLEHYGDVLFKLGETENAVKYWIDAKKVGGTSDFIDKKIADKKLYE